MQLRLFIELRIAEAKEVLETHTLGDQYDDAVRDLAALTSLLEDYDDAIA